MKTILNIFKPGATLTALLIFALFGCSPAYKDTPRVIGPKDAAESALGERIFRDFRFSKFFASSAAGNVNKTLSVGDKSLDQATSARRGNLENPFAHQAMSCVACHMVGDAASLNKEGMRAYTDFTQRTLIPLLGSDTLTTTPRNTPTLIGSLSSRTPFLLHYDGEFATIEDLILGSYTGRNFGWTPAEFSTARANIIKVLREDDGTGSLAQTFGKASYKKMFLASDSIDPSFKISNDYQLDMTTASDQQVLDRAIGLVKVYLQALQFSTNLDGVNNGSAWDKFLVLNKLPAAPDANESNEDYATRLSFALQGLGKPSYLEGDATFGEKELTGAKIFLARSTQPTAKSAGAPQAGNCVACHAPPSFTDFKFHNTGATQIEYDSIHGSGAFAAMTIPNYLTRSAHPEQYLPETAAHPTATSRFRMVPSLSHPEFTDLGAWNIFANSDYPNPQTALSQIFCTSGTCATPTDTDQALSRALASFKTPGLRLLGMSDPYLHNGTQNTLPDLLRFYQQVSALARAGNLRNADAEIAKINIDADGASALNAFLNALNEDYE